MCEVGGAANNWQSRASASVLDRLTEEEILRQELIYELIETERSFVHDLRALHADFYLPLLASTTMAESDCASSTSTPRTPKSGRGGRAPPVAQFGLSKQDVLSLFGNLEALLTTVNEPLLAALEARQQRAGDGVVDSVADVLVTHAALFKLYAHYASNYPWVADRLAELQAQRPLLADWLAAMQRFAKGRSLAELLVVPLQRVCKYPLFVAGLVKATPAGHADAQLLADAEREIKAVVTAINERTRDVENVVRLTRIEQSLHNAAALQLVERSRRLVKESKAQVAFLSATAPDWLDATLYLCNDCLLVAYRHQPSDVATGVLLPLGPWSLHSTANAGGDTDAERLLCLASKERTDVLLYFARAAARNSFQQQLANTVAACTTTTTTTTDNEDDARPSRSSSNPFGFFSRRRKEHTVRVLVRAARQLHSVDGSGSADPYAVCLLGSAHKKTSVVLQSLDPRWSDVLEFPVDELPEQLTVRLWHHERYSSDGRLGQAVVPLPRAKDTADQWLPLQPCKAGDPVHGDVRVIVAVDCSLPRKPTSASSPLSARARKLAGRSSASSEMLDLEQSSRLDDSDDSARVAMRLSRFAGVAMPGRAAAAAASSSSAELPACGGASSAEPGDEANKRRRVRKKRLKRENAQLRSELAKMVRKYAELESQLRSLTGRQPGADADGDFTQEQIAVAKMTFEKYDVDNSGAIDRQELAGMLADLQRIGIVELSDQLIAEITGERFAELDLDGSGVIEFNELLQFIYSSRFEQKSIKKAMLTTLAQD